MENKVNRSLMSQIEHSFLFCLSWDNFPKFTVQGWKWFSLFTGHMSFQIFLLVGHLTNLTGYNFIDWQHLQQDNWRREGEMYQSSCPIIMWNWQDIFKFWLDNVWWPTAISSTGVGVQLVQFFLIQHNLIGYMKLTWCFPNDSYASLACCRRTSQSESPNHCRWENPATTHPTNTLQNWVTSV